MDSARVVVNKDLDFICSELDEEFTLMEGKNLLIVGGAGFLGYYLIQSILHWNDRSQGQPITLTVFDNYMRGIPAWLSELENNISLNLVKHDITEPLPESMGNYQYVVHAASIASPIYYRKYPIETMDANVNGLRTLLEYCVSKKRAAGRNAGSTAASRPTRSTRDARSSAGFRQTLRRVS